MIYYEKLLLSVFFLFWGGSGVEQGTPAEVEVGGQSPRASVLSFSPISSWDQTQVTGLCSKHLYLP